MIRGKPPFPEALLEKLCTENIKGSYNRPIGDSCELRHLINHYGVIRQNDWSCTRCQAIFTRESRNGITKKYRVQIPDAKVG